MRRAKSCWGVHKTNPRRGHLNVVSSLREIIIGGGCEYGHTTGKRARACSAARASTPRPPAHPRTRRHVIVPQQTRHRDADDAGCEISATAAAPFCGWHLACIPTLCTTQFASARETCSWRGESVAP